MVTGAAQVGKSTPLVVGYLIGKHFFPIEDELECVMTQRLMTEHNFQSDYGVVFESRGLHDGLGAAQDKKHAKMLKRIQAHDRIDLIL